MPMPQNTFPSRASPGPSDGTQRQTQTTPADHFPRTPPAPAGTPINKPAAVPLVHALAWCTVAGLGMAILLALMSPAGHDQQWFLLMASRWLHGATLYGPEIFDSNPPLIVWLSAVPAVLGSLLPTLAVTAWAKLLVCLLLLATAILAWRALRHLTPARDAITRWVLAFAALTVAAVLPARDFGQRDHLAGLLCLPYLLLAATRLRPRTSVTAPALTLRLAAATLAAVGLALKPQQILAVVVAELTLLVLWRIHRLPRRRPTAPARPPALAPEPALLLAAGLAYLLLIRLAAPAYFTLALPLLRETYWAIGHLDHLALLREAPQLHLLALTTTALALWLPAPPSIADEPSSLRAATLLLLAAGWGATLAYHLQGTGWYYQQLPGLTFFGLALTLLLLGPLTRIDHVPRWLVPTAASLSVLAVVLTALTLGDTLLPGRATFTSPDPALFSSLAPGAPVAILTTAVEDSMMPVAERHLLWAQRTNNLWLLPAILRLEDPISRPEDHNQDALTRAHALSPAPLAALDQLQHRWVREDLECWRPALILVERCQDPAVLCQELEGRHDDLLAWLLRDPALRTLWQTTYRPWRSVGSYDAWLRRDLPTPATPR